MSDDRIDRIFQKLREKLRDETIPDDATGKLEVDLQSGGVSGDVFLRRKL